MSALARIFRHPIKSHGRESLERVTLVAGQTMPLDRRWAVAHEAARLEGTGWAPCANFSRGSKAPGLMAIESEMRGERIALRHPELGEIEIDPDSDGDRLVEWTRPLIPEGRARSARVIRAEGQGMTDYPDSALSIASLASHHAVEARIGHPLAIERWRMNLWIDGTEAWEEFGWQGRRLRIGAVLFEIGERVERCMATTANPATGERDADTLAALRSFGHQDLGVYAICVVGGDVAVGDPVVVE